jgi:MFS family permease
MSDPTPSQPAITESHSTFAPLRGKAFRMLWITWLAANTAMWMNDVAAAWLMTSLTSIPIWVALVQTASTLPVFVLGLPSGALADILDRKRFFLWTQFWVTGVALVLAVCVAVDVMTPPLLLALTFANGVGLALRWPVYAAITPEVVPREQLSSALALNAVSGNSARILGPLLAGVLIASFGSAYVFALNAVLALMSAWIISRWQREPVPQPLGRERLVSAMRVGVQFLWQSAHLKGVLLRVFLFFFHSTALLALLPLVARNLEGGNAGSYALLLASMGGGALVVAVFLLQRLRRRWQRDALVFRGVALQAVSMAVVAFAPNVWVAVPAMAVTGMAWIATINTLSVSAQLGLPNWVRARGMGMYQMAIMGASASGAAVWGQVATVTSLQTSLLAAAVVSIVLMLLVMRFLPDNHEQEDLTPHKSLKLPSAETPPTEGHVVTTIEYRIDPARAEEFRAVMRLSRGRRLRSGVLDWELLHDIADPGRFVEQVVDESWADHLRRFHRMTEADAALRDRKNEFHVGEGPPRVMRFVAESSIRGQA